MIKISLTKGQVAFINNEDECLVLDGGPKWHSQKAGNKFYAVRKFPNKKGQSQIVQFMYRLIINPPKEMVIDHINGIGTDNRRHNLRICRHKDNIRCSMLCIRSTSRLKGAHFKKYCNRWRAEIQVDKKNIHLGYFDNGILVAVAYDEAAHKYFGIFAKTNFGGANSIYGNIDGYLKYKKEIKCE